MRCWWVWAPPKGNIESADMLPGGAEFSALLSRGS